MSEHDMRSRVVAALRALHAVAVENPALPGTPDVNYVEGWIELKWLREWPKRQDTVVELDHFTPQQRVFLIDRRRRGGRAWLLLQCRDHWLLFDGAVAALHVGRCSERMLYNLAHRTWRGLKEKELLECVSQEMKPFTFTVEDQACIKRSMQRS